MARNHLFTSESVTEGHPDKIADQVSDAVLDAILDQDPHSRVAYETFVNTGFAIIGGEVTTNASLTTPTLSERPSKRSVTTAPTKGSTTTPALSSSHSTSSLLTLPRASLWIWELSVSRVPATRA